MKNLFSQYISHVQLRYFWLSDTQYGSYVICIFVYCLYLYFMFTNFQIYIGARFWMLRPRKILPLRNIRIVIPIRFVWFVFLFVNWINFIVNLFLFYFFLYSHIWNCFSFCLISLANDQFGSYTLKVIASIWSVDRPNF